MANIFSPENITKLNILLEEKKVEEERKSLAKHKAAIEQIKDEVNALRDYVQQNFDLKRELRDCNGTNEANCVVENDS